MDGIEVTYRGIPLPTKWHTNLGDQRFQDFKAGIDVALAWLETEAPLEQPGAAVGGPKAAPGMLSPGDTLTLSETTPEPVLPPGGGLYQTNARPGDTLTFLVRAPGGWTWSPHPMPRTTGGSWGDLMAETALLDFTPRMVVVTPDPE